MIKMIFNIIWLGLFSFFMLVEFASAKSPSDRFALIIGANDGGADRVKLRYTGNDARTIADTLRQVGGFSPKNTLLVLDKNKKTIIASIKRFKKLMKNTESPTFFFYYSGHSNSKGLLINDDTLTYKELRRHISRLNAKVKVIILDSCESGSLIVSKGGKKRPGFLKNLFSETEGLAIITSSSADEYSQESASLKGSFFTHFLASGLKGAADANRDRRITIHEAYQYTYQNTINHTVGSKVGVQHPSYDFQLTGMGDLFLSDLRGRSSRLRFHKKTGRFFIRADDGTLVAEIEQTNSNPREISLEGGKYILTYEAGEYYFVSRFTIGKKETKSVDKMIFTRFDRSAAVGRGDNQYPQFYKKVGYTVSIWPSNREPGLYGNNELSTVAIGLPMGYAPRVSGLTLSLGGYFVEDFKGVMVSPAFNYAFQEALGVQVSGGLNYGSTMEGGQVAPINTSSEIVGVQVGLLNHARSLYGLQLGLVNFGGQARGLQLGLVNIADNVKGISIAPIMIVRNGIRKMEFWTDHIQSTAVSLISGTQYYYSAFHLGNTQGNLLFGMSFGLRLPVLDHSEWRVDTGILKTRSLKFDSENYTNRFTIIRHRFTFLYKLFSKHRLMIGVTKDAFTFPHIEAINTKIKSYLSDKSVYFERHPWGPQLGWSYDLP